MLVFLPDTNKQPDKGVLFKFHSVVDAYVSNEGKIKGTTSIIDKINKTLICLFFALVIKNVTSNLLKAFGFFFVVGNVSGPKSPTTVTD